MRKTFQRLAPPLLIALGFTSSGALAADLGPYEGRQAWRSPGPAYYPPEFSWSGFYAGVQAGYGWGDTSASLTTLAPFTAETFGYSTSGFVGGVHLGYNWQASRNFVFGVETDLELSGIEGSGAGTLGSVHATNIDWLGSLRARAGYAAGNTLFYVTGGLAYGGIDIVNSDWRTGWTLGGGVEHAFTPNITARLEYRYTDLGNASSTSALGNFSEASEITQSAVRAGLSFKF